MIVWLALTACGRLLDGEECRVGELGCPCTHGDGCDPLLTCSSGTCERLDWIPDGLSIPLGYTDVAFDADANRLIATYDSTDWWPGSTVLSLDLDDPSGKTLSAFPTEVTAENVVTVGGVGAIVSLSPARWSSEDAGFGYVAVLDSNGLGELVEIPVDPGDLDATPEGEVCVGARSGRAAPACVDLASRDVLSGDSTVGGGGALAFHPDGDRFYVVSNGDLHRWELTQHGLVHEYLTGPPPDMRDCHASTLRVHPNGQSIWTDCGYVFYSSNDELADGKWAANVGSELDDLDFQPGGDHLFGVPADGTARVLVFDGHSQTLGYVIDLASQPRRVLAGPDGLVVVRDSTRSSTNVVEVIAYPPDW